MPSTINAGTGLTFTNDNTGTLDVQGGGVTGFSVNSSAMYVKSVTTTQRNALTGTAGMIVYDSTLNAMFIFNGSFWEQVTAGTFASQRGIFAYGTTGTVTAVSNLLSTTGVIATDTAGVGTARTDVAAGNFGINRAIFGYGKTAAAPVSISNLVSSSGVIATDTTGVGTARRSLAAAGYGTDKVIFGYGFDEVNNLSMTNLVSNTGVVATDTAGVGTARRALAATTYGTDKALFGYGFTSTAVSMTNLVSSTGVVSTDTTGVGTARIWPAAVTYGSSGQAMFAYGSTDANGTNRVNTINLVSNTGVVAANTTGTGTARINLAASTYGGDKAIFAYGWAGSYTAVSNLVSNTGVVATDTTGVGTAREGLGGAAF